MIEITEAQHAALLGMTYTRPALRALLGEALTEVGALRAQTTLPDLATRVRVGSALAEAAQATGAEGPVADLAFILRNEIAHCCNYEFAIFAIANAGSGEQAPSQGLVMTSASSSVSLSELASLNDVEYRSRVRSLVAVPSSQKVAELEAEIAQFERACDLTSAQMQTRLANGELDETLDICDWLMALKLRDRLVGPRSR